MTILLLLALWLGYELLAWTVRTVTRREAEEQQERRYQRWMQITYGKETR